VLGAEFTAVSLPCEVEGKYADCDLSGLGYDLPIHCFEGCCRDDSCGDAWSCNAADLVGGCEAIDPKLTCGNTGDFTKPACCITADTDANPNHPLHECPFTPFGEDLTCARAESSVPIPVLLDYYGVEVTFGDCGFAPIGDFILNQFGVDLGGEAESVCAVNGCCLNEQCGEVRSCEDAKRVYMAEQLMIDEILPGDPGFVALEDIDAGIACEVDKDRHTCDEVSGCCVYVPEPAFCPE
jgi:hypothetical protein